MQKSRRRSQQSSSFTASVVEFACLLTLVFLVRTFGFGLYQVPTGSMETTMLVGERFFADKFSYFFWTPQKGEIIAFNDPTYSYARNRVTSLFQQYVWGPTNWTKRVIGVPGDHVRGVIEDGRAVIYVNDEKLDEPYLNKYPLIRTFTVDQETVRRHFNRGTLSHEHIVSKSFDPNRPYNDQPFYRISPERVLSDDGAPKLIYPSQVKYFDEYPPNGSQRGGRTYFNGSNEFNVTLADGEYWLMGDNRNGSSDSRVFGPVHRSLIHGKIVFRIWSLDSDESWFFLDLLKNPINFWTRVRWGRFFQFVR